MTRSATAVADGLARCHAQMAASPQRPCRMLCRIVPLWAAVPYCAAM
ncbi:hypothetical protein [Castellaniella sp.]